MGFHRSDGYHPKENSSVKYHQVHIHRLLHKWGFKLKIPQKRFVRTTASQKEKKKFRKRVQKTLITLKNDWNVLVQDESIFIYDSLVIIKKKKWIIKEKRPIVTVTGSHSKTIIFFGVLSKDGKQLFRQLYDRFDSHSFIRYLEEVRKKFKKICYIFRQGHPA